MKICLKKFNFCPIEIKITSEIFVIEIVHIVIRHLSNALFFALHFRFDDFKNCLPCSKRRKIWNATNLSSRF